MRFTRGFLPTKLFYIHWKNTFTKSDRGKKYVVPFFPFYLFYPLAAVAVVGMKIPTGVVEPLGPWERRARSTWCTCSDSDDVCRWFTRSPTRCSAWRLQVVRLAIHVWPNMSGTYVHNLQRTTPTAFCRFSCVLRARLPVPSLATGLIIIIRTSRSDSYYILPQEGSEDTCFYQRPGTWLVLRSSAPRKRLKHDRMLKLNRHSKAFK